MTDAATAENTQTGSTSDILNSYSVGKDPSALSNIYDKEKNIAIWERPVPVALKVAVDDFLNLNANFEMSAVVTPESVANELEKITHGTAAKTLIDDIQLLVEMFSCLFELKKIGLRLTTLNVAMCPKFHVDRVPCRLVSTYTGVATEWLPNRGINRDMLGHGSQGKSDSESGLYPSEASIQRLSRGDVALLKGESWLDNSGAGLIHRSPAVPEGETRLLLTLDFYD